MLKAVEFLQDKLDHIRAGKANPVLLDDITVEAYGAPMPLNQVATVTVPDARTLAITPWDKKLIKDIEKGILDSNLGITPTNNGEMIRIAMPPLTEERRKELVKQCKAETLSTLRRKRSKLRTYQRIRSNKRKMTLRSSTTSTSVASRRL